MKRVLLTFLVTFGLVAVTPAVSFAAAAVTDITGVVTNNGHAVSDANVTVVCNNQSDKDTTDTSGTYLVQFPAASCPDSSKATVVATKDGLGGAASGKVNSVTTKLNVAIINVSLPEFGIVTSIGATVIGAGAFLAIRRKQIGQN